jgi:hypothetical protein
LVYLTTAAVIPPEFMGFNELLKIESDMPMEFYSGKALDIGSIFDIRYTCLFDLLLCPAPSFSLWFPESIAPLFLGL